MPRPPRIDLEDGWHHIMNRGVDHGDVFFHDSDRIEFGQRLGDVHERFGVRTHAYCLMDNHFHLLWHCPHGGLSDAMQRLGSMYTRHVNDRLGRDGPLFRGRFHSRLIADERQLMATARYIHRNALDLPGITRAQDYRWSSHRTYLGLRRKPEWMFTARVLNDWDPERFDRYVDDDLQPPYRADGSMLRAMVEASELILAEQGVPDDVRSGAVARKIVLAWARSQTAITDDVLMEVFDLASVGALRKAALRARQTVVAEARLGDVMSRAIDLVASEGTTRVRPVLSHYRAARAAS